MLYKYDRVQEILSDIGNFQTSTDVKFGRHIRLWNMSLQSWYPGNTTNHSVLTKTCVIHEVVTGFGNYKSILTNFQMLEAHVYMCTDICKQLMQRSPYTGYVT